MFTRSIFSAIEYMVVGTWMSIMAIVSSLAVAFVELVPSSWAVTMKRRYRRVIDKAPEDAMLMVGESFIRKGHRVFYDDGAVYVLNYRQADAGCFQIENEDGLWTKLTADILFDPPSHRFRHVTPTVDVVRVANHAASEPLIDAVRADDRYSDIASDPSDD